MGALNSCVLPLGMKSKYGQFCDDNEHVSSFHVDGIKRGCSPQILLPDDRHTEINMDHVPEKVMSLLIVGLSIET
jgi:hypothetical protein